MLMNDFWNFDVPGICRETIIKLAYETEFIKRKPKKITPDDFFQAMCENALFGSVSGNDLADSCAEKWEYIGASRQAFIKKMTPEAVCFFKAILALILAPQQYNQETIHKIAHDKIKRILIQDSTILRLPMRLYSKYLGSKNQYIQICNCRIQGVYDLLSCSFVYFSIDPYNRNDVAAVDDFPLEAGDLMLRDKGYMNLESIKNQMDKGVEQVLRFNLNLHIHDPKTGEQIDLLEHLKKYNSIDMNVLVGASKVPLRISARSVPEEIANLRRMKAKKEGANKTPQQKTLNLMSWDIYLITIDDMSISFEDICTLYRLRWRIENIFKVWKQHISFGKVHNISEHHLQVLLFARFIMIIRIFQKAYKPWFIKIREKTGLLLSLMSFIKQLLTKKLHTLPQYFDNIDDGKELQRLAKYYTLEKHKRGNYEELLESNILENKILARAA